MTNLKLGVNPHSWLNTLARWAAEIRRVNFVVTKEEVLQNIFQLPIGAPVAWLTDTTPTGYILLDGSLVSLSDYPELFDIYHYTYGGSGETFNLPDLRGRYLFGTASSGTGSTLNGTFGSIDHTHSVPAHYHGMGTGADLNITASGSHSHGVETPSGGANVRLVNDANGDGNYNISENLIDTATHTHASGDFAGRIGLVTGGVDGNAAMTSGTDNPPSIAVNWITRYTD